MIITNHRVRGAGWGRGGRGRSGAPGGPCRPAAANPRSFPGLDQTAARPPAAAFRFLPFPLADTAPRTAHPTQGDNGGMGAAGHTFYS